MNRYQSNATEYRRIADIIRAGIKPFELMQLLSGPLLAEYAVAVGVSLRGLTREYAAKKIVAAIKSGKHDFPDIPVAQIKRSRV